MRVLTRRVGALALFALAGCDTLTGTQSDHALWNALEIKNYDFVYQVSCFCGNLGPNPARLSVRGGAVVKVQTEDGSVFSGMVPPPSSYPTIDSLFVILENAEKKFPNRLTVRFDPTYHYPTMISIDPIKNAVDDEIAYTIKSFTPVIGAQQ